MLSDVDFGFEISFYNFSISLNEDFKIFLQNFRVIHKF